MNKSNKLGAILIALLTIAGCATINNLYIETYNEYCSAITNQHQRDEYRKCMLDQYEQTKANVDSANGEILNELSK